LASAARTEANAESMPAVLAPTLRSRGFEIGVGALDRNLKRFRVDREQILSGVDRLVVAHAHLRNLAADLGGDGNDERLHARLLGVRRVAVGQQVPTANSLR
jgi:hypothetical protein